MPPESIEIWDGERAEHLVDRGLDYDYIDGAAQAIATALRLGIPVEVNYQPGDGTRYKMVLVPLRGLVTAPERIVDGRPWGKHAIDGMKNPDHTCDLDFYDPRGYLLSFVDGDSYPIRLGDRGDLSHDYIGSHWKLPDVSAVSVAILLRATSFYLDLIAKAAAA